MRKKGRPGFRPTTQQKSSVAIAASAGMAHEHIALAIGVSRNTLEKYFEHELTVGAYQRRMERMKAMHAAAKKGNVAAAKYCDQLEPKAAAPPLRIDLDATAGAPAEQGKKAQANADAVVADKGTEWEQLLTPPSRSLQ